jgi:hypothetical protein
MMGIRYFEYSTPPGHTESRLPSGDAGDGLPGSAGWLSAASTPVYPDLDGVSGSGDLAAAIGALLTIVLILSVLMLVVCAAGWAIASSTGAIQSMARARVGVWVSLGAAVLAGAAVTWTNFLIDLGSTI